MSIPLLTIKPTTQNQRVDGYEVPDEDNPQTYRLKDATSEQAVSELIWAAYRQIYSEHLILESYRQTFLESQLRNRTISVRDFIRGLGKSDTYRQLVGETNSNYRLVDISFKRFLGRSTYNKQEQIAWSIVIATKGLHGFIDAILDSEEYRQNFGDDIVPYQRRRYTDRPFNLVNPRYTGYWRDRIALQAVAGSSYYQIKQYGPDSNLKVRIAIPNNFMSMAATILPNQQDTQRDVARACAVANQVKLGTALTSETTLKASVKPTSVSLPYRYIPPIKKY